MIDPKTGAVHTLVGNAGAWSDSLAAFGDAVVLWTLPDPQRVSPGWRFDYVFMPTVQTDIITRTTNLPHTRVGPYDIAVTPNLRNVYLIFDPTGPIVRYNVPSRSFMPFSTAVHHPSGLAITPQGLYVTSRQDGLLYHLGRHGQILRTWPVAGADGLAYDRSHHRLIIAAGGMLDVMDLATHTIRGLARGFPVDSRHIGLDGVSTDAHGTIYAADAASGASSLWIITPNGKTHKVTGAPSGGGTWQDVILWTGQLPGGAPAGEGAGGAGNIGDLLSEGPSAPMLGNMIISKLPSGLKAHVE